MIGDTSVAVVVPARDEEGLLPVTLAGIPVVDERYAASTRACAVNASSNPGDGRSPVRTDATNARSDTYW